MKTTTAHRENIIIIVVVAIALFKYGQCRRVFAHHYQNEDVSVILLLSLGCFVFFCHSPQQRSRAITKPVFPVSVLHSSSSSTTLPLLDVVLRFFPAAAAAAARAIKREWRTCERGPMPHT
jgi:hypothetical protein